ncbi:MAG: SMUG2 DNA glycosylase family protein [Chitinophagaceae bacterium]|nr:SMUG2 DNA glycosylase family protein [Chitinophagaceae bacterium]
MSRKKKTIGEQVIEFNRDLHYTGKLPKGFDVINPFRDNPETMEVMERFYKRYYHDNKSRRFLIGINPGRKGAGVTGVPFTDTKRLENVCGIPMKSARTHEPSSMFIYDMIEAYGGPEKFYGDFYINSPFPLAIVRLKKGKWLNANYYDDTKLFNAVEDFMIESLKKHVSLGLKTDKVYSLGIKNTDFLKKLNEKAHLFGEIIPLEHPRFIQQYKSKEKELYIAKYLELLHPEE